MKPLITLLLLCHTILACQTCSETFVEHMDSTNRGDGNGNGNGGGGGGSGSCFYESQELLTDPADSLEPETTTLAILPSQIPRPSCVPSDEYNVYLDPSQVFAQVSFCSLDSFAYYLKTTFVMIWRLFYYWMQYSFAGSWNRTFFQWRLFWVTREPIYWFGEEESRGEGWLSPPDLVEIDWWTWRATDGDLDKSEKRRVLRPSPPAPLRAQNCTTSTSTSTSASRRKGRRNSSRCCKNTTTDAHHAPLFTPMTQFRNSFNQPQASLQTSNAKATIPKRPQ